MLPSERGNKITHLVTSMTVKLTQAELAWIGWNLSLTMHVVGGALPWADYVRGLGKFIRHRNNPRARTPSTMPSWLTETHTVFDDGSVILIEHGKMSVFTAEELGYTEAQLAEWRKERNAR